MRKRAVTHVWWLYALGFLALVASLVWTQTSLRSLGNELEQTRADNAALAAQVRSLGGQPVAEPKPGARGDQGPQGIPGPQGPPGIQGPRGPIGVTGQTPACLLEPSKCVGPKGATGTNGKPGEDGTQGPKGDTGATGPKGDQGIPGVAGKDGVDGQPGAPGKDGVDGKDGRGITSVTCQADGSWLITYTDSSTSTTDGPCRVTALKVGN